MAFTLLYRYCTATTVPLYRLQVYHIDQDMKQAEGEIRGLREELAEAERSLQARPGASCAPLSACAS